MNLCMNRGFSIWNIESTVEGYSFYIAKKQFKDCKALFEKTGTKPHILHKYGLPFYLFRYRKRHMFVLGILICLSLIYICSIYIWDINITGANQYTQEEIIQYIEKEYYSIGVLKKDVNCNQLEADLRNPYPKIAWISCDINGTQLNVNIKETLSTKDSLNIDDSVYDLVALKDGTINIYNDYDEILETDYTKADGDVIATTNLEYQDSFSCQYYDKKYSGHHRTCYNIQFAKWYWELPFSRVRYTNYDTITQ